MGEIALALLRWTVRISFWGMVIGAWVFILAFILTQIFLPLHGSLLADLFAVVQIWLPFNIGPVMTWVLVASSAYLTYRVAIVGYNFINMFIGNN